MDFTPDYSKGIQEKFEQYKAEKIQSDAEIAELKQQIAALKKELEARGCCKIDE